MFQHKTSQHIGPKMVTINLQKRSTHVKKLASKKSTKQSGHYIFKKTELLHLVKKMKRTGVKLHSLRRGGILEMYYQDIRG